MPPSYRPWSGLGAAVHMRVPSRPAQLESRAVSGRLVVGASALAGAVVLALGVAVAVHPPARMTDARTTSTRPATTGPKTRTGPSTRHGSAPTTVPPPTTVPTAAVSAALEADLLVPADEGGFYRVQPSIGQSDLGGSSCLATLAHQPGQVGTALSYLEGPNEDGLPGILELLTSYRGAGAARAFRADMADLAGCAHLVTTLDGGGRVDTHLAPVTLPALGEGDFADKGAFSVGGVDQTITVAVVRRDPVVLTMVYLDSVPPADALYDNFVSALVTSFGKLA